jgi:hypothetical protein
MRGPRRRHSRWRSVVKLAQQDEGMGSAGAIELVIPFAVLVDIKQRTRTIEIARWLISTSVDSAGSSGSTLRTSAGKRSPLLKS